MNVEVIWNNFLDEIKTEVNSLSFETWFENTYLYDYSNKVCKVVVPMSIHKTHLLKYHDVIIEILNRLLDDDVEIQFLTQDEVEFEKEENINNDNLIVENINKVDISSEEPNFDNLFSHNSKLQSKYTFDNYIVGNTNKFAQKAALEVAKAPGSLYNPLFIYGNSGLGKTHLMHAIGNYIVEHSNLKVLYVRSDEFISDFMFNTKKDENGNIDKMNNFKEKYRNLDVLIVDDIQFLQNAEKSQEEFFNIFNKLYGENKQIILSSDRSPTDLKKLEDRLKTRFCWGLTVDIHPPDFELRVAIIKKKLVGEAINQNIPDDVIEYIASNVGNDVRTLEGSITRLLAYSTFMGGAEITLDVAVEALKNEINKGYSEKNSINKIQRVVAEYFQISVDDMKSKKRSANLTVPRQIAMYLCRKMTDESFPKIAIDFGGKDHTTVMYSVEKVEKEIKENEELAKIIEKLKKDIS